MDKNKIAIIGTGAWGSALANVLLKNNHNIIMYGINQDEINDINNGYNRKYFGNKRFHNFKNLAATNNLDITLKNADYVILATPSSHIKTMLKEIQKVLNYRKINLINVAKGIDSETKNFFSELIYSKFRKNLKNMATLIGPSYAVEVFENELTMINVVGRDINFLAKLTKVFNNDSFKLVINKNEKGSELFAALKNVLAIGVGIISYSNKSKNTQSAMLTIGVKEIHKIYKSLFPELDDEIGFELAGIGDIFLTCSSNKSRNFSFGLDIADKGLKEVLNNQTKTVEGYTTAKILEKIIKEKDIYVPFMTNIINVLYHNKSPFKILDFLEEY